MLSNGRRIRQILASLLVFLAVLALGSCYSFGSAQESASASDYDYYAANDGGPGSSPQPMAAAERLKPASSAMAGGLGSALAQTIADEAPRDNVGQTTGEQSTGEETEATKRLRVFSADLELVVASVGESRDRIITIVETSGGYVESSRADYMVVRVPAVRFEPILAEIESTGDVRSRAVRTADVTDQYFDIERRLHISEASRERLLELLEETDDSDERVAILRDIRRLTEEIEQLRSSLESLEQLIRFSRITIQLVSRIQASQVGRQEIPFWWIAALSPVASTTYSAGSDIPITPDESFAVFETGPWLFAEAADGTQIRAGAVANEPAGDKEFWQSALIYHLGPFYRTATPTDAGDYSGVLLQSKDSAPFYYLVLVHPREDELVVAEVFFPNSEARETRLDDVLSAIATGGAE